MSKNRNRGAQPQQAAAEVQQDIPYLAVELQCRVKIEGEYFAAKTIITDLDPDLKQELLDSGAALEVEVLIPADEITDGDGNPVDSPTVEIVGSAAVAEDTNPSGTEGAEGETA